MSKTYQIALLSDATGETVTSATEAVASQFVDMSVEITMYPFVRSVERAKSLVDGFGNIDLVIYTVVHKEITELVEKASKEHGFKAIPLLDPVMKASRDLKAYSPVDCLESNTLSTKTISNGFRRSITLYRMMMG